MRWGPTGRPESEIDGVLEEFRALADRLPGRATFNSVVVLFCRPVVRSASLHPRFERLTSDVDLGRLDVFRAVMTPRKYEVQIAHVHEVSLVGEADLTYWKRRLATEGLRPTAVDGRAQLLISAIEARFLGKRFRECIFSVFVSQESEDRRDGAYLAHAFNSVRFFAWVERTMFHTPYFPARLEVQCRPAHIRASQLGRPVFEADRAAREAAVDSPLWEGEDGWEGPIYLPPRKIDEPGRMFHARIGGFTRVYTFGGGDTLRFVPRPGSEPLAWFYESGFTPKEWHIRESATHGKSKTVRRV